MRSKKAAPAGQVRHYRELARTVVKHHFGTRPRRLNYLDTGLSNFVFEAVHDEGLFVVRISPDKSRLNAFIKEQWAESAARTAGVPTAEILEIGFSVIPFPYMIARRVDGISATDHPQRAKIIRALGAYAAKINAIRTAGFGETFDWSQNLLSRNETLREFLQNEYRYDERIELLMRHKLVRPGVAAELRKVFRAMERLKTKPSLNHGDLRLKNVIADEAGEITAIIDWEKAISNIAPFWELSLALHDLGIDHQQLFIEGYGVTPRKLVDGARFLKAFNMLNYVPELERAVAQKDRPAIARLELRFNGTFDLFTLR